MIDAFDIAYTGPLEIAATDLRLHPMRFVVRLRDGLPAGGTIRLVIGPFRALLEEMHESNWRLDRVSCDTGALRVISGAPADFWAVGEAGLPDRKADFVLAEVEASAPLPGGAAAVFEFHGRIGHRGHAPLTGWVSAEVASPGAQYELSGKTVLISRVPDSATRVEARLRCASAPDGTIEARIFRTDAFFNVCNDSEGVVRLRGVGFSGAPECVAWSMARRGRILLKGLHPTGEGVARLFLHDEKTGSEAASNAVLPDMHKDFRHYFGAIHFHTEHSSDGGRPLFQAYEYARDVLGLDVCGAADHHPVRTWPEYLTTNEAFNQEGEFVTLPAWESDCGSWGGHINIYLREPSAGPSPKWPLHSRESRKWDLPYDRQVVFGPHGTNIGDGHHFNWPLPEDFSDRLRIVEMVQARGCSETNEADAAWGINPDAEGDGSVREALSLGHRLAFVGGTDNHSGFPSRAGEVATEGYNGLTAFMAPELSREAIFESLSGRRTYATSGVPILCEFALNGVLMGGEMTVTPGADLQLAAAAYGTAQIRRVELISGGACIEEWAGNGLDFAVQTVLSAPEAGTHYFYMRVLQDDGHRAWTSPVWILVEDAATELKSQESP